MFLSKRDSSAQTRAHRESSVTRLRRTVLTALCLLLIQTLTAAARTVQERVAAPPQTQTLTPKFPFQTSALALRRRTRPGAFLDVLGRKSALFGYEHGQLEAWAYPLQILDELELSFKLEGYPLDMRGADTASTIEVRPEATVITYSHAAFTVRQIIFAPLDEAGVVMLFDVDSALPLSIDVSFRPRLKLMWPAGLM